MPGWSPWGLARFTRRRRRPPFSAPTSSSARPQETEVRALLRRDRSRYRRFPGERVRDTACEACEWLVAPFARLLQRLHRDRVQVAGDKAAQRDRVGLA